MTVQSLDQSTETIKLADGHTWEIRRYLTRGMEKRIEALSLEIYSSGLPKNEDASDDALNRVIVSSPELATRVLYARDDLYLELGSVSWSYEEDLTLENIDAYRDRNIVKVVLDRMKELYEDDEDDDDSPLGERPSS